MTQPLFKMVNGTEVPLTEAEIAEREAEEAEWAASAALREIEQLEAQSGLPRFQRDVYIRVLDPGVPKRVEAEAIEARAVELGLRAQ